MTAYYNEIDEKNAAWLRILIEEGHIAPGHVDTRSIVDVRPGDLEGYRQCHFFAGIGGWSLALRYADWRDTEPVWTGSCPCQPFSAAGQRKGFADERHLWPELRRLVSERRPAKLFGEQVASAADWLRLVRGDLEALGYAVGAIPIEAACAGADHLRKRFWFVANGNGAGLPERVGNTGVQRAAMVASAGQAAECNGLADADKPERRIADEQPARQQPEQQRDQTPRPMGNGASVTERKPDDKGDAISIGGEARPISGGPGDHLIWVTGADGKARRVKSGVRLLAHGIPGRVGLLRGFGNAIDPRPAAAFIKAARYAITQ